MCASKSLTKQNTTRMRSASVPALPLADSSSNGYLLDPLQRDPRTGEIPLGWQRRQRELEEVKRLQALAGATIAVDSHLSARWMGKSMIGGGKAAGNRNGERWCESI